MPKLPGGGEESRGSKGGEDTTTEGQVGVHDRSHLSITFSRCAGIEAGPEHPQEDGSNHGEEITGVAGTSLLTLGCLLVVQHATI